jgi:phosphohistidine phosphatase
LKAPAVVGTFRSVDLYLMRHGEAGESPRGDPFRPLTPRGRAQATASARGLARLPARPTRLLHSPYLRAEETAGLVGAVLGLGPEPDERFTPDADPDLAARVLLAGRGTLLVVAHLPILPGIAFALGAGRVQLGTASVVHLAVEGGAAVVAGLWTSEQLAQWENAR